ncbi:MAG: CRISPR-associated endonuclease Cas1 [Planctomycetota bacterium]|nr:hypothetical protein [Planctomycetota bacterium]GIK53085.1 MAG: CRISPR-associated endonuclease Cas1 [Planctomycetota bacterium]
MTERILDFSDEPARLSARNGLLVVSRTDKPDVTVPLAEIAVVVASHPQVSLSLAVLAGLAENKAMLVACDAKRLPASMTLPIAVHFAQGDIFEAQARASQPTRKRLWKRVVRAKLRAQAALLAAFEKGSGSAPSAVPEPLSLERAATAILALLPEVTSGDRMNIEAQAARKYWGALTAAKLLTDGFSRDADGEWPNPLFNYGYAVLRAIVARALCACGLHPSFGLHHHNKYDAFRLADDLMEPFRPIVDRAALLWLSRFPDKKELDRASKQHMAGALLERLVCEEESRTLFDVAARLSQRLAKVLIGERQVAYFKVPEVAYAGAGG